jgi:hypothetical protein
MITNLREPREVQMPEDSLEERQKEIFRAFVDLKDKGYGTEWSRNKIANQFSISVSEVQHVEREGIANNWPPLSDDNHRP